MDAFSLIGPALRLLDPETAHNLTLRALEHGLAPHAKGAEDPVLATRVWGLSFANPIGLAVARLLSCDVAGGVLELDAMDCLDGTPLLDIKPYLPSIDAVPDDLVRNVSLVGPRGFVKERLAAYAEAGVTTLLVQPVSEDRRESVRYVEELRALLP